MNDALDLSIIDSGDPRRIIAIARYGSDLAIEPLACNLKTLDAFRLQLDSAAKGTGQRPSASDLVGFGRTLFQFVVQAAVLTVYQRLPNTHIRLQIFSNRADLQSLPWEFVQQPGVPPGPNALRSVVRIVPTVGVDIPDPAPRGGKLRMLFVYADPIDQDSVNWEDIKSSIEREFSSHADASLEMEMVEGASPQALFKALGAKDYDILHFAGHGQVAADGTGELLFVNLKTRKSVPLSATELGMVLKGETGLRLVVLSACSTSSGDFTREFTVVAQTLVESGVPAVVANQFPITNSMAAKFAGSFYQELLRSGDVDQATTRGRMMLALEPSIRRNEARFEWGIPTLYRHVGAARLIQP